MMLDLLNPVKDLIASPVNQDWLESQTAMLNVGDMTIEDDSLLSKQETIGFLSFTVTDMSRPKKSTESSSSPSLECNEDPVKLPKEPTISTKKPAIRAKVPFEIGCSPMDWLKLTRKHPDLAGLKGVSSKRLISIDEVKQHKTEGSIWTVLKGRVYNISPYMKFHPGGYDMLMKAAGKDCTSLFNKYHAWVNAEALLEKCLVGTLDDKR
ncbi:hypothetical protein GIB67_024075 [Kingdonia uniflora]|uniref:Cytochrome b5 heme-binding domain-containing protein n=1 Tax=Kingdonia uniflora TaxID=39325 RepID=A0A7J7MMC7_9MAGN|nr:hypothetical protein GIB67_024075 [Kingdonia uniflora]